MCLAVPGRIESVAPNAAGLPMARVSFGGIIKEVCLAYVPEATVGDYVIVHAGFAISQLNEEEAQEVFDLFKQIDEAAEREAAAIAGGDS
jgi:hydrogenase expression/formation protein HypC